MGTIIFNDSSDPNSSAWLLAGDAEVRVVEQVIDDVLRGGGALLVTGHNEDDGSQRSVGFFVTHDQRPTFTYSAVGHPKLDAQVAEQLHRYVNRTGHIRFDKDDQLILA